MFKNLKIRNKILLAVLSVVVLSLVSTVVISFVNIRRITNYSEKVNTQLTNGAVSRTEDALLEQAGDFMNLILKAQVDLMDSYLNIMNFRVTAIENAVYNIFTNPQSHNGYEIIHSSEAAGGFYAGTWSLAKKIQLTDDILREINLLSNLEVIITKLAEYPSPLDLYVGMESGLLYTYTTRIFENTEYDPREESWYKKAAENPFTVAFSEIHESPFGAGQVITLSFSINDNDYSLIGVAGLDIPLDDLIRLTSEISIANTGYMFILNENGEYISHPDYGNDGFTHFRDNEDVLFADGLRRMMNGERGYVREETDKGFMYLAFAPSAYYGLSVDWSVGLIVTESELLSAKDEVSSYMNEITQTAANDRSEMSIKVFWNLIIVLAVSVLVIFIIGIYITHLITKPIQKLSEGVATFGGGAFENRVNINSQDEIGILADVFNQMADNIVNSMEEIAVAVENERRATFAKDSLEKLNRSKMAFLGNISHELKTPLTVISNVSQLTAFRTSDDYVKDKMNVAVLEVERMKNTVNQLLEITKIEDEGFTWNFQPENIMNLISTIASHYFQVLDEHNNTLTIKCPESLPFVKADAGQFKSLLINLIHNATRFTYNGCITVGATYDENARVVTVFVEDTGQGMVQEQIEHIFDRFYSSDDSTGTGLGLYICKKIIDAHEGAVRVQSELGRGTKISFTLSVWED